MKNNAKKILTGAAIVTAGSYIAWKMNKKFIPNGMNGVKEFDLAKYLGKWYEIARLDYLFERNLNEVTAEYSLNSDGSVKVSNRGLNNKTNKWVDATGKAKFVGEQNVAELKVSFFGPFYSGYNVIGLTPDYRHALVCGENKNYLWILSRDKQVPDFILHPFLEYAEKHGFATEKLFYPIHS